MHNNDWSLIFFTLLSQLGVGIVLVLGIIYFANTQHFHALQSGGPIRTPQFIALVAIAIATFISFFHLGHPAHAFHAANNLGSSWLSREILGIGLFGAGVFLVFLISVFKWQNAALVTTILIFTVITGLFLVYAMSGIYMIGTIPAWNIWFTPFHFFMSAIILGSMVLSGFFISRQISAETVTWILRFVTLFLLFQMVAAFLYKNHLVKMEHAGIDHPDFTAGMYHTLYLIRLFAIFIAAVFTAYLSIRVGSVAENFSPTLRFYGFVFFLIVVEEIIGRYLFYEGFYRIGV